MSYIEIYDFLSKETPSYWKLTALMERRTYAKLNKPFSPSAMLLQTSNTNTKCNTNTEVKRTHTILVQNVSMNLPITYIKLKDASTQPLNCDAMPRSVNFCANQQLPSSAFFSFGNTLHLSFIPAAGAEQRHCGFQARYHAGAALSFSCSYSSLSRKLVWSLWSLSFTQSCFTLNVWSMKSE